MKCGPVRRTFVLALPDARGRKQFMIWISEQINRERELVAEVLVRLNIICTHADDGSVRIIELLLEAKIALR